MLLISQRNCLTVVKEFSFFSGILLVLSWLSFLQLSLSQCQHLAVRDKHHQTPKYPTASAQLGTHRKQCVGSRSQTSIPPLVPQNWGTQIGIPTACTLLFLLLCFTLGIWDSLLGFLLLIVVQMFYVWWITSPTLFPTCFSSSAQSIYTYLNSHLDLIKKSLPVGFLTVDLHVWPDFHGNRSPLTDLTLKGMVRNSLSLQKGQYRVKKKKKNLGRRFNFEHTPP